MAESATSGLIGLDVGGQERISEWFEINQRKISQFGVITHDEDPMHSDPYWARKHSPFGGTIAYGFFTVSILSHLLHDALGTSPSFDSDGLSEGYPLNYGFNRLRLIEPAPVGSRIRGRFKRVSVERDEKGRERSIVEATVEIEGNDRPALVAEWLLVWVPGE